MRKNKSTVGMILVCLLVFYGVLFLINNLLAVGKSEYLEVTRKVKAEIQFADGHFGEYDTLALPVMNRGDRLIFTLQLDEAPFEGANALIFYQYHSEVTVRCGEEVLYERGQKQTMAREMYGDELCIVEIPDECWGKEITVDILQMEGASSNHYTDFYIMRTKDARLFPLITIGMVLIFFATTAVLSIAAIIIWLVGMLFRKNYSQLIVHIAMFSLLVSIWQLSQRRLFYVFFSNEQICALSEYYSMYLAPIPLFIFLAYMKKNRKAKRVYYGIASCFMGMNAFAWTRDVTAHVHLIAYEQLIYHLLAAAMILTIVMELSLSRHAKKLHENILRDGILLSMGLILMQLVLLFISARLHKEGVNRWIQRLDLATLAISLFMASLIFAASRVVVDIIRKNAKEEQLSRLAYTDILTGLCNRQFCEEQMQQLDVRSRYCIVFMDVDGLKKANDHYGHAMGDKLISVVAEAVRNACEKMGVGDDGFYGRWGGDEFLAAFKQEKYAETFTKNLHREIDRINEERKLPFELTVSYGIAVNEPGELLKAEQVRDQADEAMYAYKKAHKRERV